MSNIINKSCALNRDFTLLLLGDFQNYLFENDTL